MLGETANGALTAVLPNTMCAIFDLLYEGLVLSNGREDKMSFSEVLLIAIGLSMDAFAVSLCRGATLDAYSLSSSVIVGGYFGCFQAAMPLVGAFIGERLAGRLTLFSPYVSFTLLSVIGIKMMIESRSRDSIEREARPLYPPVMLALAFATSIDALAVGVAFALVRGLNVYAAAALIGLVTFSMSGIGVAIGRSFGIKYKSRAEVIGGAVLILMGIKFLLEGVLK